MVVVNTPVLDTARTIFTDLGYTVERVGDELRAERKWRVVYITARDPSTVRSRGQLRCFVTPAGGARSLLRRIGRLNPTDHWVVMEITGPNDYDIHRP